jgi:hypothetical protein
MAKTRAALIALALLIGSLSACSTPQEKIVNSERFAKAKAMFDERCKTAGEKIYRTVENVDGIYLLKIRTTTNHGDQFRLDDPYGHDSTDDEYLKNFIRGYYHQRYPPSPGALRIGYSYVEAISAKDGLRYRYTGGKRATGRRDPNSPTVKVELARDPNADLNIYGFVLDRALATGKPPRYGVTFDDISTREEREHWIAGSSLKIIDLETNEVIAERIGYMVDWAQGSGAGGRSPWLFAADNACPSFRRYPQSSSSQPAFSSQPGQTLTFVEKALKPSN